MNISSLWKTAGFGLLMFSLIGAGGATVTFANEAGTDSSDSTFVQEKPEGSDAAATQNGGNDAANSETETEVKTVEVTKDNRDSLKEEGIAETGVEALETEDESFTTEVTHDTSIPRAPMAAPIYESEVAPYGPSHEAVGDIDNFSRSEVQKAYEEGYLENSVNSQMSNNVDVENCKPGQANVTGARSFVNTINFFRSLNGLNLVELDSSSNLSDYMQQTALILAANGKLSHFPKVDGMTKCMDRNPYGDTGAGISNIAETRGLTPAEQVQWFMQDWSPRNRPINDNLGHRLNILRPDFARTSVGFAGGYSAMALPRNGVNLPGVNMDLLKNPNAVRPVVMTWPSRGYFPKQVLTGIDDVDKDGYYTDFERWSVSFLDEYGTLDLSKVNITVTRPDGRKLDVKSEFKNKPNGTLWEYKTLMIMFPKSELQYRNKDIVTGLEEAEYTVKITGIKGGPGSTLEYPVILFDGNMPSDARAPKAYLQHEMVGVSQNGGKIQNIMATPVRAVGNPMPSVTWQRSDDGGKNWEDVTSPVTTNHSTYTATFHNGTGKIAENTMFRAKVSNSLGTTYTHAMHPEMLTLSVVGGNRTVERGSEFSATMKTTFDGNGYWVNVVDKYWMGYTLRPNGQMSFQSLSDDTGNFSGARTQTIRVRRNFTNELKSGSRIRLVPYIRVEVAQAASFQVITISEKAVVFTVK